MSVGVLGASVESDVSWIAKAISQAVERVRKIDHEVTDFPHITKNHRWTTTSDGVWTGGFWAGLLWLVFETDRDEHSRQRAIHFTDRLLPRAGDDRNHDLGFMFVPSAIKGWQLEGREDYRRAAIRAAWSLAGQYSANAGFIPGWGFFGGEDWSGNVLVDTLMNLPLIVWAVEQGEDPSLLAAARGQADTTTRYHMRADGSLFHMYRFVPGTGQPIAGDTYQGHAAETTWSRGQAWGIAGLAMLGGMLGDGEYVAASERAARYFLSQLPADGVPPWDFQAPPNLPFKDASAGAIASFGFLKLYDATGKREHLEAATRLLAALAESCANDQEQGGLLLHSTADLPHGLGIEESVMYGDYYYLKSLLRLRQRLAGNAAHG